MKLSERIRAGELPIDSDIIADEVAQLEEENEELKRELNAITNGAWTQREIDAAKWQARGLHALLTADGGR